LEWIKRITHSLFPSVSKQSRSGIPMFRTLLISDRLTANPLSSHRAMAMLGSVYHYPRSNRSIFAQAIPKPVDNGLRVQRFPSLESVEIP
jgi:hypothetical protein